ncbi:MAG: nucleotidyltransferase family protein [Lentisphaerae bacterium]|jgi:uncharacterized protein|nr:nucleotidyltransferase family protein [Lentisphaerota bacterium]MBT5605104.1 nucleotidyltransferase family protein [Lentisphaerota bacterium]MBT7055986.1 nucleotidyltransferase family protein [Lentisphaerota bacterium]MBT7848139.1 nucleotidyltransferase family protein [Lentisphaerota bacterium]
MTRQQILEALKSHHTELTENFAAASLALFGSASRDDSDVDLLVSFRGAATFDGYFGLKRYLEALLGRRVDLVTPNALKPRLKKRIEEELVHVA